MCLFAYPARDEEPARGPITHWAVEDIGLSLQQLLDAGAERRSEGDVGAPKRPVAATDPRRSCDAGQRRPKTILLVREPVTKAEPGGRE